MRHREGYVQIKLLRECNKLLYNGNIFHTMLDLLRPPSTGQRQNIMSCHVMTMRF